MTEVDNPVLVPDYKPFGDSAPMIVWACDAQGSWVYTNPKWETFAGPLSAPDPLAGWIDLLHPDDRDDTIESFFSGLATHQQLERTYRLRRHDGEYRWIRETAVPQFRVTGEFSGFLGFCFDFTEERHLRDRLREVAKLDAIGRLAGGLVHEFNNLLTIAIGYCGFVLGKLEPDDPMRRELGAAERAAEEAATLARQLLMFARRKSQRPRPMNWNDILRGADFLVPRVLGTDVRMRTVLNSDLPLVQCDPEAMEYLYILLLVAIRGALIAGGEAKVTTTLVKSADPQSADGDGIRISFELSAATLDSDPLDRLMEVRLSTQQATPAAEIVAGAGGTISLTRQPQSAEIVLIFPRGKGAPAPEQPSRNGSIDGWSILVVDDDPDIRDLVTSLLSSAGAYVVCAGSPVEALAVAGNGAVTFDAALLDVHLPDMTGFDLADRLAVSRPDTPVLFMSGCAGDEEEEAARLRHAPLIEKPFTPETLIATLSVNRRHSG